MRLSIITTTNYSQLPKTTFIGVLISCETVARNYKKRNQLRWLLTFFLRYKMSVWKKINIHAPRYLSAEGVFFLKIASAVTCRGFPR
jgi:hypothetical protein